MNLHLKRKEVPVQQEPVHILLVDDQQDPAVVSTDKGTMRLQRRLPDKASSRLIGHLQQHEDLQIPCVVTYIQQGSKSGSVHTLINADCPCF